MKTLPDIAPHILFLLGSLCLLAATILNLVNALKR